MISKGRLSKSFLLVNKTKWCSRGPPAKNTLQTTEWVANAGLPAEKTFWGSPGWFGRELVRVCTPLNYKHKSNKELEIPFYQFLILKSIAIVVVFSRSIRKLVERSPRGFGRKLAWFSPPRDYFGDNSSPEQKRRRSKFSGVRAFGKLLTERLQVNNMAINPVAAPQGSV